VPIYLYHDGLDFRQGFVWGAFFYFLHLYPIAEVLYVRGQGEYRMIVYIMLVVFFGVHSGLWFYYAQMLRRYIPLSAWPLVTYIYFMWMQTGVFWICDICEGYPFALPIIPLGEYADCMFLLPLLSVYGLTACLICAQWSFASVIRHYFYERKNKHTFFHVIIAFCCYTVFIVGFFLCKDEASQESEIISHIVYISPSRFGMDSCTHPMDCTQEIAYALQKGIDQYHSTFHKAHGLCFVFPESTFPFILYEHNHTLWQSILDDNEDKKLQILLGAHEKPQNVSYNCLSLLNQRRIMQTYAKNHAVVFTERIPYLFKGISFFNNLFGGITDRSNNKINKGTYSLLIKVHTHYILPILCSQLFYNDFSPLPFQKVPILLLCNDNWFSTHQIKNLMFLYAKIYAMSYKRPIIYVSFSRGIFFSETGRAVALSTIA